MCSSKWKGFFTFYTLICNQSDICAFYSLRLESSGHWMSMRQRPSFPAFFQAKLYLSSSPKDTYIKLPVSRIFKHTTAPLRMTASKTGMKSNYHIFNSAKNGTWDSWYSSTKAAEIKHIIWLSTWVFVKIRRSMCDRKGALQSCCVHFCFSVVKSDSTI